MKIVFLFLILSFSCFYSISQSEIYKVKLYIIPFGKRFVHDIHYTKVKAVSSTQVRFNGEELGSDLDSIFKVTDSLDILIKNDTSSNKKYILGDYKILAVIRHKYFFWRVKKIWCGRRSYFVYRGRRYYDKVFVERLVELVPLIDQKRW